MLSDPARARRKPSRQRDIVTMLCVRFAAILVIVLPVVAVPAKAERPALPTLPATIDPGDLKPYLAVFAKGVQIYVCGKDSSSNWTWAFKAPEADLMNAARGSVSKHYAGPTWEGADGGKVLGTVKASADAPDPDAIPWLRLDIKSREGTGAFTQAEGVLRVATVGGKAPAGGCDAPRGGSELRVPYTATYYFLR